MEVMFFGEGMAQGTSQHGFQIGIVIGIIVVIVLCCACNTLSTLQTYMMSTSQHTRNLQCLQTHTARGTINLQGTIR